MHEATYERPNGVKTNVTVAGFVWVEAPNEVIERRGWPKLRAVIIVDGKYVDVSVRRLTPSTP